MHTIENAFCYRNGSFYWSTSHQSFGHILSIFLCRVLNIAVFCTGVSGSLVWAHKQFNVVKIPLTHFFFSMLFHEAESLITNSIRTTGHMYGHLKSWMNTHRWYDLCMFSLLSVSIFFDVAYFLKLTKSSEIVYNISLWYEINSNFTRKQYSLWNILWRQHIKWIWWSNTSVYTNNSLWFATIWLSMNKNDRWNQISINRK